MNNNANSTIFDFYTPGVLSILDSQKKKIFANVATNVPEEYKTYSTQVDGEEYQYNMIGITGLSFAEIIADGQIPSSDAPIQGFAKTITQMIITKRVQMSQQEVFFLFKKGNGAKVDAKIEKQVTNIKDSITHTKNLLAQSMLAGGWGSSISFSADGVANTTFDTTGADGVPFFSLSHPREDGGAAWSNVIVSGTNNPTLSLTSIIAARAQHVLKKDGRGMPLMLSKLDKIMCLDQSPTYTLALTLSKTLASGKYPSATPGVSGSFVDANPTDSFDVVPLINYTGGVSSLMYFMYNSDCISEECGLQYVVTMPLVLSPFMVNYFGNMDLVSTGTEYCSFGGYSFRGFMASNGTNV